MEIMGVVDGLWDLILMDIIGCNVEIAGFRSSINDYEEIMQKVKQISREKVRSDLTGKSQYKDCTVQLLNAEGIAGEEHIIHATLHALKAFRRHQNIAQDLGLEICVRASAQRQISKAIDILGIKNGEINICVVAVGCNNDLMDQIESLLGKRDDDVIKPDNNVLKRIYDIPDLEEGTAGGITRALMERTTLLIVEA